jgi:phosphoribosylformylglycinamidine synthase subunit PurQ / glutaminase
MESGAEMKPKILVLCGDGINCERETARAFDIAGGETTIVHVNDLLVAPKRILDFHALALPGGFSFGDDLGSGQVLGLKLSLVMGESLRTFVDRKKPIIGICNGFQALTKMGLLPDPFSDRVLALAHNRGGHFINRWVRLVPEEGPCIWTKGMSGPFDLPIRHGEGRIVMRKGEEESIHRRLSQNGQVPLRYQEDVNGSFGRIAALCDPSGLIFGLMPHPEAAISLLQYPDSPRHTDRGAKGIGMKVFENCINHLKEA